MVTSNVVYIILSIFDALAVFVLGLKLHRQSLRKHHRVITLGCITVALSSFLFRVVLDAPLIDLPVQIVIFSLFLRYGFEYKFHWSLFMTVTGISAYIPLQLIIIVIMTQTGLITSNVVSQAEGWGVSVIQIASIVASYIIGFVFYSFGFGFSFILEPPHDFNIKEDIISPLNRKILISTIVVLIVISVALITVVHLVTLWILPVTLVAFGFLYYYSNRRDGSLD